MMGRHDGKAVVITGGTSGIGLVTAQLLQDEGARVLVTGSSDASVASARDVLRPDAVVVKSDTSSIADIRDLAAAVEKELGTFDVLYVNAGVSRFGPFESTSEADYDDLFAVNAKGPYFTVQQLAPLMNDGGAVVVTTSVVNAMGYPMVSAYSATKAALRSMVRSMARELLPRGIRVNAVSPGPTDTGILEKSMPAEAVAATKAAMSDENPMGRFARSGEIAKAVEFLAFDATFTTGAELAIDGGHSQL
jgi:NAD(P)-dependent dehydrogenase (short-subunit alcohol dehydrogenase family)